MKVTTGLLGFLARGWAGFTTSGPSDSAIEVPPAFLNGGSLPQSIFRLLVAGTVDIWNVTHVSSQQNAINTTNTIQVTKLSEGLWQVDWQHYMEISGAVADITAVADFTLSVVGLSGSPVISRLRDDSLENKGRSGSFRFSVLKGQEIVLSHSISSGAGTSTQFGRVFVLCSRLL